MKFFSYLLSAILLVVMGCSSGPDIRTETGPDLSPTMSPMEVLDASEGWLAPETAGLVVVSGPDGWDELEHYLFPLADASLSPGMPGTAHGLATELRELFVEWLGFDLTQIHSAVIGVHAEGARVVVFGDVGEQINLPRVEGAEGTVYELSLDRLSGSIEEPNAATALSSMEMSIYVRPLEGPRQGLVFGFSQEDVTAGTGLSGGHGEELRKILREVDADGPSAVFAGVTGAIPELALLGMPLPDSIVVSFGDLVTFAASGDEATLGEIAELIEFHFEELRLEVAAEYDRRNDLNYGEQALLIYGYHLMEGMSAQLRPDRTEGMLRYDVEFAERGLMTALALSSTMGLFTTGLGSWLFADPYDDYYAPGPDQEVIMAVRDIEACSKLAMDMIEIREVPVQFLPATPLLAEDLQIYLEMPVKHHVDAGSMILTTDFAVDECN